MEIADQTWLKATERKVRSYHARLTIMATTGIQLDYVAPGMTAGDFASMVVFSVTRPIFRCDRVDISRVQR